jgi:putative addiction module killer protein
VYCKETGQEIIILLCAGTKSTQQGDIERAKKIALELLEEKSNGNS